VVEDVRWAVAVADADAEDNMDKILRNVIIFAALILVIATAFTVATLSKRASSDIGSTAQTNMNNLGDNVNTQVNTATTGDIQNVKLSVSGANYILTPSTLKKDVPVRMVADMATLRGCSRSVVISAFGVRKSLTEGDNIITFTPTQSGTFRIACSMNMYTGTFTVE
jgi:plastocyanin domain-containing protein